MQTKNSERAPRSIRTDARDARGPSTLLEDRSGAPDRRRHDGSAPEPSLNATLRELDERRDRRRLRRAIRLATLELNVTLRALELRRELIAARAPR